jgi:hypothetical protein
VVLALSPLIAGAQQRGDVVITPYLGLFAPGTDLGSISASAGGESVGASMQQQTSLTFGLNASYWFNRRVGMELGGAFTMSDLEGSFSITSPGEQFAGTFDDDAYVLFGSAKVMFNLLSETSPMNLRLGVGPAVVSHQGDAFESDEEGKFTGLTDFGAAVSLCTRIPITSALGLRVRVEDYMYQSGVRYQDRTDPDASFDFDEKFQHDVILSLGFQLPFGR